jgi:hypothetical protein
MRNAFYAALATSFMILIMLAGGCSEKPTAPETGSGYLKINLSGTFEKGRPEQGPYDEVNVQVVRVDVHRANAPDSTGGAWITVADAATIVDLQALADGTASVLADTVLPAGYYTQVRLVLGDSNTVVVDGEVFPLTVPSGNKTGLKLNHPFVIDSGALYEFTVDFDSDRSVHRTGNGRYMLKPVMAIIVTQSSGALTGVVWPDTVVAVVRAASDVDTLRAMTDGLDGTFAFPMLRAGSYDLLVTPQDTNFVELFVHGVEVIAMQTTVVDTLTLMAAPVDTMP